MADADGWPQLPGDLVDKISNLFRHNLSDYVRFRAVCKPWRLFSLDPSKHPMSHCPWIIIGKLEDDISFFSPNDDVIRKFSLPYTISGSIDGHLFMFNQSTRDIFLLNPLTMARINFPPLTGEKRFTKIILLDDGTAIGYIRVIHSLVFAKPGDDMWSVMGKFSGCTDILMYHDCIYVVNKSGVLARCELRSPSTFTRVTSGAPNGAKKAKSWNLVENLSGEMLLIGGYKRKSWSVMFVVYKLGDDNVLIHVDCLGDEVVFLGQNRSFCMSAKDLPGWKRNCIYYAPSRLEICYNKMDFGIYSLEDEETKSLLLPDRSKMKPSPPIFFRPSLFRGSPDETR